MKIQQVEGCRAKVINCGGLFPLFPTVVVQERI